VNHRAFFVDKKIYRFLIMTPTVADIIKLIEAIAPPHLAETWDNCGLQVGKRQWPVTHIRTALDPLPEVVSDALADGVDLLVTHHPLLFKPVKQVDFGTALGQIIRGAATGCMAVYAAHTSLDTAPGGLNDILADRIGLEKTRPLVPAAEARFYKLVIFVPTAHVEAVTDVLVAAGAGTIGAYSGCTFRTQGQGTFIPGPGTNPYAGKRGRMNQVAEDRIETLVAAGDLEKTVAAVKAVHPYESMAYDAYPLAGHEPQQGLGRIGQLETKMELGAFADHISKVLGLSGGIRLVGDPQRNVSKAAVCTGSGSSLTEAFLASGADVYVSGDMHYHDARSIEGAGLGLVDIGHFASEHIMVGAVADLLRRQVEAAGYSAVVTTCEVERDPFRLLIDAQKPKGI
jgi:dinuclear metal center YbgI/SA1388 family protein